MVKFSEVVSRIKFWRHADRIGPDIPFTHWRLHFPSLMRKLCESKFKHFGRGAEFRYGACAVVCSKISIGEDVLIRPGTMLFADPRDNGAGILIEDFVLVGSGVHIYTSNHRYDNQDVPIIEQGHMPSKSVRLCKGCWIGANAIILPGVEIGNNSVVGAGSVVTTSVPPGIVVAGNPAKVIKSIDSEVSYCG